MSEESLRRRPYLLVAASGLAREVMTVLDRLEVPVRGVLDDAPGTAGTHMGGHRVLGTVDSAVDHPESLLVLCAGKGTTRRALAARLAALGVGEGRYATVVDPAVRVPHGCSVGAGSVLLAGTVLTADVTVGRHVVCMPQVTLTHDDVVGDFATLAAGVVLGGGVTVGEAAYLGMNSSVRERVRVGAGATLGMGAVLLDDLPPGETWVGVPARPLGGLALGDRA